MNNDSRFDSPPPGSSPRARGVVLRLSQPLEKFLHVEASSGILLMLMAATALVWANSPWVATYHHLLHAPLSVGFDEYSFTQTFHFWVNEILMVIFFFVVGLEIRRELHAGVLSDMKRAALPIAAALGGMLFPALIYLAFNLESPARGGWGVPMATDIAFAVGVLALLGKRVPPALRILLLAVAIIDDVGAVLVIAVFYSSGIALQGLAIVAAGVAAVLLMQRLGFRNPLLYVGPGAVLWGGLLHAGIHPTIAGVILGLMTPARSWIGREGFLEESERALETFKRKVASGVDAQALLPELDHLNQARREAIPPVTRIEAALHPWVAFGIMPLFALANAGVTLGGINLNTGTAFGVVLGIGLGLVFGKPLGVLLISWLAVRFGLASLPQGISWPGMLLVGCLAGIGFTMALFITALAFPDSAMLSVAKLAVLIGSAVAAMAGLLVGRWTLARDAGARPQPAQGAGSEEETRASPRR